MCKLTGKLIPNTIISTKNPKAKYYGGSESSDFRVTCGIAHVNIGHRYIDQTPERLNIKPGKRCESHASKIDKNVQVSKIPKEKRKIKFRRNQLHCQKTSKLLKCGKMEGKTDETNVRILFNVRIRHIF